MTETMTIKSRHSCNQEDSRAILEHEIQSLEILIDKRTAWLSKAENKRRSTYNAVQNDTRQMVEQLDELRDQLTEFKTQN